MNSLHFSIWAIIIACIFPYVFSKIAVYKSGYDLKQHGGNHREFLQNSTGLAARANAVQQNSFEILPLFIASILMAEYLVVSDRYVVMLGTAFLILRTIYAICYLLDYPRLRSLVWSLATACPLALLVLCTRI
ncbi:MULTISPECIES: MAPEG family protein [unclassified Acinetobacter]|uniref:MAPEG family protein n=1 Tax=unclassified Acinetobacter TaxID=196816 RepID=UPI0035B7B8C9